MASSRGRERLRQREAGGVSYAFGSSTPRDFSYLSRIPRKFRQYDIKMPAVTANGPNIVEYMRQARSLTPSGQERGGWAFGSSTPRDLSHITAATRRHESRSVTRPSVLSMTRSVTVEAPRNRGAQMPFITRRTQEEEGEREEVSSEPDLVQDRALNFEEAKKKLVESQSETPASTKRPPKPTTSTTDRTGGRTSPKRQKSSSSSRPQSRDQPSPTKSQTNVVSSSHKTSSEEKAKSPAKLKTELEGHVKASLITSHITIEKPIGEEITVVQDVATEFPSARTKSNRTEKIEIQHNNGNKNLDHLIEASQTLNENIKDEATQNTSNPLPSLENHVAHDLTNDL